MDNTNDLIYRYPGFPSNRGRLEELNQEYLRGLLLQQILIARAQQDEKNQKAAATSRVTGAVTSRAAEELGSYLANQGSGSAVVNASQNIPASYLPSLSSQPASEVIGTMADGSPMLANSAAESAGTTIGDIGGYVGIANSVYQGTKILGSNMSAEQKALGVTGQAQDAAANYATGGLYGLGRAGINMVSPKLGKGIQHVQNEFNKYQAPYAAVTGYQQGQGKGALGGAAAGFKGDGKLKDYAANIIMPGFGAVKALSGMVGGLSHKTTKQYQNERNNKLSASDPTYRSFLESTVANRDKANAASTASAADFVGLDANGIHVNNKYKNSGNVKDLTVNDITGSQTFFENDKSWMSKSVEDRNKLAQSYLDQGLIGSSKGMITADHTKFNSANPQTAPLTDKTPVVNPIDPGRFPFGNNTMIPKTDPNRISAGIYKNPNGSGNVRSIKNPWRRK